MLERDLFTFLIKEEERIAKKIAKDMPEIARDYKNGLSQREIVIKYDIMKNYFPLNVSIKVGMSTVGKALKLLIPEKERRILKEKIQKKWAGVGGLTAYLNQKGIHNKNYNNYEKRIKATLKGLQARDKKPFKNLEKKMILAMAKDHRYLHQKIKKGHPDFKKIQATLKEVFGYERSIKSLEREYLILKKNY
ncbi:MAG: hypothetical protein QW117_00745 [Candidatus Pacearchaeota archaeon]